MALQSGMAGMAALHTSYTSYTSYTSVSVSKGCGVSTLATGKPAAGIRRSRDVQLKSDGLVKHVALAGLCWKCYLTGRCLGLLVHRRGGFSCSRTLVVQAKAWDADAGGKDFSEPGGANSEADEEADKAAKAQRVKIGVFFITWWTLNVVFNIYNKKVLNAFPFPWLTATLSLATGGIIMGLSWLTGIAEKPDLDAGFWKALAPVAFAHTVGHVAATISMSKVAVSFTHIIKSSEPAFSVIVSKLLFGENFSGQAYFSLLPIIGGCALAAATELNFNTIGFVGAMVSNIAFVFRNIFSKRAMVGKKVGGMNYFACLSLMSLVYLTPFSIAVEGPKAWAIGWQDAVAAIGPQFVWWVAAQSVFYLLYNQVSYMSLNEITPLTFSIGSTMKGVSVIVASIIIFRTPVRAINCVGASIAIAGTFLYSQAK